MDGFSDRPTLVTVEHPCADATVPPLDEIVELCRAAGPNNNRVLYPPNTPRFFIKYGSDLEEEARTQDYIYRHTLMGDASTAAPRVRVPQVYLAFCRSWFSYVVMDYLPLPTVEEWLVQHPEDVATIRPLITSAVGFIVNLPLPGDGLLGPVGGGRAKHTFFRDYEAPFVFTDAKHVEKYVNKALTWACPRKGYTVNFETEPLQFYDADPADRNFLYDAATGALWRVDFEHVGILPRSFALYALCAHEDEDVRQIGAELGLSRSDNVTAMERAAGLLSMCGRPDFGMRPRVKHTPLVTAPNSGSK